MKLHICTSGSYAEGALEAYRNGTLFAAVKGVTVRRSDGGRDACLVDYKGQQVWRLDVDVVSDIRTKIREIEYQQMAAYHRPLTPSVRLLH